MLETMALVALPPIDAASLQPARAVSSYDVIIQGQPQSRWQLINPFYSGYVTIKKGVSLRICRLAGGTATRISADMIVAPGLIDTPFPSGTGVQLGRTRGEF